MTEQSKVKFPDKKKEGEGKLRGQYTALNLLKHNRSSPLKGSYENTLVCKNVRTVITKGNEVHEKTSRCKTRACPMCEKARMAKNVAEMEEGFSNMIEPMFVTLTVRVVTGKHLAESVKSMYKAWRIILKSEDNKRRKVCGIRKAECHPSEKYFAHFHYHFHVLIDGLDNAEWLVRAWIEQMGNRCDLKGQNIEVADKGTLLELSKYINKSLIDTDKRHKKATVEDSYKFMDRILTAIRRKKTIQPFGSFKLTKLPKKESQEEEQDSEEVEVVEHYVNNNRGDWETEEGNLYCGFDPSKERDKDGKLYSEKYQLIEVVKLNEIDESRPYLDPAVWLNKWPDLQDTA